MKKLFSLVLLVSIVFTMFTVVPVTAGVQAGDILFEQNFENAQPTPVMLRGNAVTANDTYSYETDGENTYLKIKANSWQPYGFKFDTDKTVSGGIVRASFDFKKDAASDSYISMGLGNGTGTKYGLILLATKPDRNLFFATDGAVSENRIGSYSIGIWYTYEIKLDIVNRYASVKVTNKETGAEAGSFAGEIPVKTGEYSGYPTTNEIDSFGVRINEINLDNIRIEKVVEALNVESAELVDGNVEIIFSTAVDESTLKENITLKDSENNVIEYEGSLDGVKYTMVPSAALAAGEYTCTVGTGVQPLDKDTFLEMSEAYTAVLTVMDKTVLFSQSFENAQPTPVMLRNGDTPGTDDKFSYVTENGNTYLKIQSKSWKPYGFKFDTDKTVSSGKVRVSFKFRQNTFADSMIILGTANGTGVNSPLVVLCQDSSGTVGVSGATWEDVHLNMTGSRAAGEWYTYAAVIDVDNQSMDVSVADKTGAVIGTKKIDRIAPKTSGSETKGYPVNKTIDSFGFRIGEVCIDDINIEKVIEPLSVKKAEIVDGNVEITFSAAMDESTLKENITLKDSKNNVIEYEGSLDGVKYTVVPAVPLTAGEYTCTVGTGVQPLDKDTFSGLNDTYTVVLTVEDKTVLFSQSFENAQPTPVMLRNSAVTANDKFSYVTEDENTYLKIKANSWQPYGFKFDTDKKVLSGTVYASFDFKKDEASESYISMGLGSGTGTKYGLILLATAKDKNLFFATNGEVSKNRVGVYELEKWYTYEIELDIDNRYASVKVTDKENGGEVGTFTGEIPIKTSEYSGYPTTNTIDSFGVRINEIGLDNIKVKKVYKTPQIDESRIKIFENTAEQTDWNAVSPLSNRFEFNFGTELLDSTVTAENIYIIKKDAQTAERCEELKYENGRYVLTLADNLAPKALYRIHIAGDVKNPLGVSLGQETEFSFITGLGEIKAELSGITKGNAAVDSFSDFSGKVNIGINFTNGTGLAGEYCVVIAFYGEGNVLKKVELIPVVHTAEVAELTESHEYTVPTVDGAVSAKIMVWNSLSELRPVSANKPLN